MTERESKNCFTSWERCWDVTVGLCCSGEEYVAMSAVIQPVGVCVTVQGSIWWEAGGGM
jgi:hypothetical protein